jgi:tetratricopeptide (TPR) repeat protein
MVYNNIGVAYSRMSEYERAVEALSKALEADPRYVLPRANRARNLASIARFDDALNDMDAVIKLKPSAMYYAIRAEIRDRNSDLNGALADYSEAIKKQPNVAVHYNNRGTVFGKLSKHAEAIEDFSRAMQLNPRDPSIYFARGLAWANAGKCDQAIPDYTKAIELSTRFSSAYNNRGVCYSRGGKRDEAIADYETALKWEPGNELARRNLAAIKSGIVPTAVPPAIEVPKFEIPPVRELLKVPEYSIEESPAATLDKKQ